MNIKSKIQEWQEYYVNSAFLSPAEISEECADLELVLYAIDTLKDGALKQKD